MFDRQTISQYFSKVRNITSYDLSDDCRGLTLR